MTYYPALIRKEPASDVGVEFPDFPGCVTAAPTLDEALSLAGEALRFHVLVLLKWLWFLNVGNVGILLLFDTLGIIG